MASNIKIKNEMLKVTPDLLDFSIPNPRFAGIDYDVNDATPYGDAIDKMYGSMVETYKKTGSLLLQPIICEQVKGKYVVRAGYTRAMTFVTRYEDLCKEIGATAEIPVYIMDGINIVDSLTENVLRSEQHFITLAHAIRQAVAVKGVTLPKIASQLGISVNRATSLRKIAALNKEAIKLCFEGVIDESGATALCDMPDAIQKMIIDEIYDRDLHTEGEALDDREIVRLSNYCMPEISESVPEESFVDLYGNVHPNIKEEKWYINVGNMFDRPRTSDSDATKARARAYWEKFIEENKLKVVDRYDIMGYISCDMGTHPEEVACWDYDGNIRFFVKPSLIESVKAEESYVEKKQDAAIERVNRKITSLKEQARKDVVFRLMKQLNQDGASLDYAVLAFFKGMHINNALRTCIEHLLGDSISNGADLVDKAGASYAMTVFLQANLMTMASYTPNVLSMFFKDNNIDLEKEYENEYSSIELKRADMTEKATERSEEIDDDAKARRKFVVDMCYTNVYETGKSVYNSIDEADEALLTYICKNIGIPYKGSEFIMRMRVKNLVNQILNTIDDDADAESMLAGLKMLDTCKSRSIRMFNDATKEETLNGTDLNTELKELASILHEYDFVSANAMLQTFDIKGIIKSSDTEQRRKAMFVSFFTKVKECFNFKTAFAYKNDKNKYQVIS
jgi:hypothetical protein